MMLKSEKGHYITLLYKNRHATIVYCLVFWSYGMSVGFLGPTLWDLGCQTETVLPTMTWVIFSQSLFTLIGSMIAGIVIKHLSPNPVLLAGVMGIGATLMSIPLCGSVYSLAVVLALMGLSMGLINTTGNVVMIRLYHTDVSPFLQAVHFFYGVGAFLSPMIADPFLENFDCTPLIKPNSARQSFFKISYRPSEKDKFPATLIEAKDDLQVDKAFWIMVVIQLPVIAALIWLMVTEKHEHIISSKTDAYEEIDPNKETIKPLTTTPAPLWIRCWTQNTCGFITIICLGGVLLFLADGMQAAYGGFVFSYAKIDIRGMTSEEAAVINALFWGTFAIGLLVAILIALYLHPSSMLLIDIVGLLAAMLLMLISPHSVTLLFIGTALFGFSLASVYPATLSLVEQFIEIGPSAISYIVVSGTIGDMLFPLTMGRLLDYFGPISFLVFGTVVVSMMLFVYLALVMAGMYEKKNSCNIIKLLCPCFYPVKQLEEPSENTILRPLENLSEPKYTSSGT